MSDLIKQQDVIDKLNDIQKEIIETSECYASTVELVEVIDYILLEIYDTPTVEAKPVVHGEWKSDLDSCGWINHTCSHCGYEKLTDIHVSLGWNFCPNCGSDMRGEKHD